MPYDAGALARLFQINFAPSFHYQVPNPSGYRPGTELNPIQGAGGGVLANTRTTPMGYYGDFGAGFQQAGATQTSGGGLWGSIVGGLQTILPAIFAGSAAASPVGKITPMSTISGVPAVRSPAIVSKTMGAITQAATQHPVLTAAGGAAATVGGAVLARRLGRRAPTVTQHPDGTVTMRHHRRMNPCNIKALRRAIRRAHSFERIATKVMHFTRPGVHPHGFKRTRRKKRI